MAETKTPPRGSNHRGHDTEGVASMPPHTNGTKECSIAGCNRTVIARGWCGAHYAKWSKYGDPLGTYTVHGNTGRRYLVPTPIPSELSRISPEEVAWVAGLYEGEGSIVVDRSRSGRRGRRKYASPRMQLNSTDRDVIARLHHLMGGRVGFASQERQRRITGRPRKDQWEWTLQGYEPVTAAFELLEPWLKERRRAQFRDVFDECDAVRRLVRAD